MYSRSFSHKIKHKKIPKVHKSESEKEYKICQKQQLMT